MHICLHRAGPTNEIVPLHQKEELDFNYVLKTPLANLPSQVLSMSNLEVPLYFETPLACLLHSHGLLIILDQAR